MLLAVLVRLEPEEVARLTLERGADFAEGRKAGLNFAFTYLIKIGAMHTRFLSQGIAVRDAADVHKALNFVPEEIKGH